MRIQCSNALVCILLTVSVQYVYYLHHLSHVTAYCINPDADSSTPYRHWHRTDS